MASSPVPPSWRPVVGAGLRLGIYAVLVLGVGARLLTTPAEDGWALFGEDGRLERAQLALLGVAGLLGVLLALRDRERRPLGIAAVGLVLAVVVREHNNHLKDHVGDGAWQAVVAVVAVATIAGVWTCRDRLLPSLVDLVGRPAFGWLGAGVLLTLFAQILDEKEIWHLLLGEEVPYAARRMGEESVELAAYALVAIGLGELLLTRGRAADRAAD